LSRSPRTDNPCTCLAPKSSPKNQNLAAAQAAFHDETCPRTRSHIRLPSRATTTCLECSRLETACDYSPRHSNGYTAPSNTRSASAHTANSPQKHSEISLPHSPTDPNSASETTETAPYLPAPAAPPPAHPTAGHPCK